MLTANRTTKPNSYTAKFKLLRLSALLSGGAIILFTLTGAYFQSRPLLLPITHKFTHNNHTFYLEVAATSDQLAKGLKYRTQLPSERGMLFKLGRTFTKVRFWMHKVKVPLDIIYLHNGVIKTVVTNAPPCSQYPCPFYYGAIADQVLELKAGTALKINLKEGDKILIKPLDQ
ncbi:DUF192 domain-containing protein [Nostoc sp. MG11]|uniref:DUF192 domain-containing protein n=1 Tax=Nostoc sp. MG11 TaxID=2721166 RepID=UPI001865CCF8|nr:DUF192 domain-containing protein [Nostoc sp. MG11]